MREMICNLALILQYITLSNKTYNVTEFSHTPYDGIRTYYNLNILFLLKYTCSIDNLPHNSYEGDCTQRNLEFSFYYT